MRGGPSGTSSTSGRVSARTPRQPLGGASAHHSFSSVAAVDGINFVQISRLHKVIEKDEDDDEYDYGSSSGSSSRCNQQQPLASRSRISSSSRGSNNIPLGRLDCQIAAAQWATSGAFSGRRPPRATIRPHATVGRWRRRPLAMTAAQAPRGVAATTATAGPKKAKTTVTADSAPMPSTSALPSWRPITVKTSSACGGGR